MVDVHKKQRSPTTASDITDLSSRSLPLQRRRVWRACECCRRKKIKCDGHEPVCSQCTQTNSTCTWIQTKDRAALSRHYVQELEARLVQMEGLLTQVGSSPGPDQSHPDTPFTPGPNHQQYRQPSSPASSVVLNTPSVPFNAPAFLTDPNVKQEPADPDHFGQLALDGHGHLRWIGGSSAMTLVDAFRNISNTVKAPSRNGSSHPKFLKSEPKSPANNLYFPPILRFNSKARALPGPEEVEFPPRDLADKLVAAYFTHFHHTLPVVDSTAFLSQYRRIMDDRRIASASDTGFPTVVFSVFACAARFVDDPRLETTDPDTGEGGMAFVYYERAMILYYIGHTATQLAHVQAFVLLASFLASINSLPQSWLMCGQAVRIAQDLGLHRSPRHLLLTPIDKETRRKVWWCVYGLDRMLAIALGRPLGIEDADCDVELPLDIDDVALPRYFTSATNNSATSSSIPATPGFAQPPTTVSLMKGFNALTCLWKIAGQVLRSVYALDKCKENLESDKMAELQVSVDRLDRLLSEWCDKLPPPFKSSPQTSQQVSLGAILCSCYYAITVTLHRNFIPTSLALRAIPRSSSVAKAVTASRSCIFLAQSIKDVIPSSHWLAFFSQYLFSSAIIILLCIMHATDQGAVNTAMTEVGTATECLESLERFWPGAKKCKELLKELADLTLTKVREAGASSPAKRDRLMMAAESIMAENSGSGRRFMPQPTELLQAATPTSVTLDSPVNSQFANANASRKRSHPEDDEGESVRLHLPDSFASPLAPVSPASPYTAQRQARQLPTPSPLGFNRREFPVDRTSSGSSSYAFGSGSIASPSQYSARWSTPRTAIAGLEGESTVPIDFALSNAVADGLESSGPFSLGTPSSSSRGAQQDSAYLPQFPFSFFEDVSMAPAPSPAQFDLTDLPFSGLDCLQNFSTLPDPSLDNAPPDSLWSQLSASPFKMGRDLPFGLADGQGTS